MSIFVTFYRPHKKYGEGNVFTGVCLFTGGGLHSHNAMGRQTPSPKKADPLTRIQILLRNTVDKREVGILLEYIFVILTKDSLWGGHESKLLVLTF